MAEKRAPMRMCVGCREMTPKRELVRVVRTPENEIKLDLTGKASGRGAYLCRKPECFAKAKKSRALERALEHKIGDDIFARLEEELTRGG